MEVLGPVKIDNLNLYGLPTGHNREAYEANGSAVEQIAGEFPLIIPEYFPPEYRYLQKNPFFAPAMRVYNENNFLFEEMAKFFQREKKHVWVVDPARDLPFAVLRQSMHTVNAGLLSLAGVSLLHSTTRLSRRNLILGGTAFTILTSTTGTALGVVDPFTKAIEDGFREAVAAGSLTIIPKYLDSETDGLIIYPEPHLKAIFNALQNPEQRIASLNRFGVLKAVPLFRSLFQARYYPNGVVDEASVNPAFEI